MLNKDSLRKNLINRRVFIIIFTKIALWFVALGRLFYLQLLRRKEYTVMSDNNRISTVILPPARGQIFDCQGRVIVKNKLCFQLFIDKSNYNNFKAEVAEIRDIFGLNEEEYKDLLSKANKAGRKIPAVMIDYLSWPEVAAFEERKGQFKALFIDAGYARLYSYSHHLGHLVGYLTRARDADKYTRALIATNFRIGATGIERYYEQKLQGKFGHKQIEVDAKRRFVRELAKQPFTPGEDLRLNINAKLTEKISHSLDGRPISVIITNCDNGGLVSYNSSPAYNPNKFSKLSHKYWRSLLNNPNNPLMNKPIAALYPPGSIFKIVTVLAALEAGIDPYAKRFCHGGPELGGNSFRCSRLSGHGHINMFNALKYSCNGYIYQIAKQIGPEAILIAAKKFGFGELTDIDLPFEKAGFLPSLAWKQQKFGDKWRLGDTLNLAIGQGYTLCTPMQLANLITAIANDGKKFKPHILQQPANYTNLDIKPEHISIIKKGLYLVLNSRGGTSYSNRLSLSQHGVEMAGKTGTAQVRAKAHARDNLSREDINWRHRNHAIFTGYLPANKPKFTITVFYEHGGSGGRHAGLIANNVASLLIKEYKL